MPRDEYPARQGRSVPAVSAPREFHDGADWLRAALLASAADGHAKLVVDVASTQFADPLGPRMTVHAYERALAEARAQGLRLPSVIVRSAPGIFWLSGACAQAPTRLGVQGSRPVSPPVTSSGADVTLSADEPRPGERYRS
jgi:hypothetical protein